MVCFNSLCPRALFEFKLKTNHTKVLERKVQMSLSGIKLFSNFMRATLPFVGRWTSVFVFGDSFSTRKTLTSVYSSARPQNLLWNPLGLQTNPGQWDQHWCIGFILFSFFCDFNVETTVVLPTARPPTNHPHSLICIGTCVPSPIDTLPQYSH